MVSKLWNKSYHTYIDLYWIAPGNGANCTLKLTVVLELPWYLVLGDEEKQVVAPDECLKNEFRRTCNIYKQPISIFQYA